MSQYQLLRYHAWCDWCPATPTSMIREPGRGRHSPACDAHGDSPIDTVPGSVRLPILASVVFHYDERDGSHDRWAPDGVLVAFPSYVERDAQELSLPTVRA